MGRVCPGALHPVHNDVYRVYDHRHTENAPECTHMSGPARHQHTRVSEQGDGLQNTKIPWIDLSPGRQHKTDDAPTTQGSIGCVSVMSDFCVQPCFKAHCGYTAHNIPAVLDNSSQHSQQSSIDNLSAMKMHQQPFCDIDSG